MRGLIIICNLYVVTVLKYKEPNTPHAKPYNLLSPNSRIKEELQPGRPAVRVEGEDVE